MASLLHIASLIFIILPSVYTTSCYVTFYKDKGYGGDCFSLYSGQSVMDLTEAAYKGWNDQISGLRITPGSDGSQCWVHACWNTECTGGGGSATDYIDDTPYVGGFANDEFSALSVGQYTPNVTPYVMYYKSCIGTEDYAWFSQGDQDIFATNFESNNIGNDALSALVVSMASGIIMYIDDQYEGNSMVVTGQTLSCLTAYSGWNDQVSSTRQYSFGSQAYTNIQAFWSVDGIGASVVKTIQVGYTTSETTTTQQTVTYQLTTSVSAGFDMEGITASAEIQQSYSNQIMTSISDDITQQYTTTYTVSCSGVGCPSGTVILYTWQFQMNRDWTNKIPNYNGWCLQLATAETQCICSAYPPPACPPGYCDDPTPNSCNTCALN